MGLFFAVLTVALVFAVAAVVVGREARRLGAQPPRPLFDLEEALEFVANRLPFEVSAQLSHDDVRQILRWHLEYFRARGVSTNGDAEAEEQGVVVVGGSETVDYLLARADQAGLEVTPPQMHAVVQAQLTYLRAIGAIGPVDPPEDR